MRPRVVPIVQRCSIATDEETGGTVGSSDNDAKMYEGRLTKSETEELMAHHEREKAARKARFERFIAAAKFQDQSVENNARTLADIESRIGDLCVRGYDSAVYAALLVDCVELGDPGYQGDGDSGSSMDSSDSSPPVLGLFNERVVTGNVVNQKASCLHRQGKRNDVRRHRQKVPEIEAGNEASAAQRLCI